MQEVKFRGKCINEDAWAYGSLIQRSGRAFIFEEGVHVPRCKIGELLTEVILESVGEFTGLKDKNGREIYEGDVLLFNNTHPNAYLENWLCVVKYRCGSFVCEYPKDGVYNHFDSWNDFVKWEVIGNVFKNSDLLEDKR